MRKRLFLFIICFLLTQSAFAKEKFDVNNESFLDFGRYVETLEINDEQEEEKSAKEDEQEQFEEEAISDVARRYEENAIELKPNDNEVSTLFSINKVPL